MLPPHGSATVLSAVSGPALVIRCFSWRCKNAMKPTYTDPFWDWYDVTYIHTIHVCYIYLYIWLILVVNVVEYTIHGFYGMAKTKILIIFCRYAWDDAIFSFVCPKTINPTRSGRVWILKGKRKQPRKTYPRHPNTSSEGIWTPQNIPKTPSEQVFGCLRI